MTEVKASKASKDSIGYSSLIRFFVSCAHILRVSLFSKIKASSAWQWWLISQYQLSRWETLLIVFEKGYRRKARRKHETVRQDLMYQLPSPCCRSSEQFFCFRIVLQIPKYRCIRLIFCIMTVIVIVIVIDSYSDRYIFAEIVVDVLRCSVRGVFRIVWTSSFCFIFLFFLF